MEIKKRDDTAKLTAKAMECSARYVRMIVNGDRKSLSPKASRILNHYNSILKAKDNLSQPVEIPSESTK
jgi:hypothetical protein